jgi:phosphoribosylanthranilate isomerase
VIVKVCGVRTAEVARAAVDEGADWIGLMFEPRSPRFADEPVAREVAAAVRRDADLVGVFVAPSVEECERAATRYGLAAVQVHGAVDPDFVVRCDLPVIRAVNAGSAHDAMTVQWWPDCLLLLDAQPDDGALPGGTGIRVADDWAAEVARHRDIILAGGLGPDNVAAAIAAVRPAGVDASSGLEVRPGIKDPDRVRRFVRNARAASAEAAGAA